MLYLPRVALLAQLGAIRRDSRYAAFLCQRQEVAKHLYAARVATAARQLRVRPAVPAEQPLRLQDLPKTITWRRRTPGEPGRFEILYEDGVDLMRQASTAKSSLLAPKFAVIPPSSSSLPRIGFDEFAGRIDCLANFFSSSPPHPIAPVYFFGVISSIWLQWTCKKWPL